MGSSVFEPRVASRPAGGVSPALGARVAPIALLVLAIWAPPATPQPGTGARPEDEAKHFVQNFYDWYTGKVKEADRTTLERPLLDLTLHDKASLFDAVLLKLLQEDAAASGRSPAGLVGLDFDPFLNSQDPAPRYEVGMAAARGERARVEVFGLVEGKRARAPDVIVELARSGKGFVFANFLYPRSIHPEDEDLISVLKALRRERETP